MKKMMECKTCGAMIAKSAKTCPQCGAQQTPTALLIVAYVIAGIGFFFLFLLIFSGVLGDTDGTDEQNDSEPSTVDAQEEPANVPEEPEEPEEAEPAPIEITAEQLWSEYSANEVAASDLYEGETLLISGTIQGISEDILTNDPCITLSSGDALGVYGIQCFFTNDADRETISKLSNGEYITIKGRCTGKTIVVQLTNCVLP